ncbi:MAG: hypothetical protein IKV54_05790, partial [Clostridia bacterium]|nr:hypothetical protein [Clostridia bacterium]
RGEYVQGEIQSAVYVENKRKDVFGFGGRTDDPFVIRSFRPGLSRAIRKKSTCPEAGAKLAVKLNLAITFS